MIKKKSNSNSRPNKSGDGTKSGGTLKEVQIKGKKVQKSIPKSDVRGKGEVVTSRIDSMKKANPALGKKIGSGYKGSGGMTSYGDDASDAIKAGLKGKK